MKYIGKYPKEIGDLLKRASFPATWNRRYGFVPIPGLSRRNSGHAAEYSQKAEGESETWAASSVAECASRGVRKWPGAWACAELGIPDARWSLRLPYAKTFHQRIPKAEDWRVKKSASVGSSAVRISQPRFLHWVGNTTGISRSQRDPARLKIFI